MLIDPHGAAAPAPDADRISRLTLPGRAGAHHPSARAADLALIARAPDGFLDTTHFDTVRFPPPDWAATVMARVCVDGAQAYSPYRGHATVRAAVARNTGALLGIPVDPDANVLLVPGTQAGLFATLSALADVEKGVALTAPDYLFNERILRFLGVKVVYVPLHLGGNAGPSPDLDALEAAFRAGVSLFVFSHPNNPTGSVYAPEAIAAIARLAVQYDVTVWWTNFMPAYFTMGPK